MRHQSLVNLETAWEKRGRKYGSDMRGVLPKSFPNWLNNYLHSWMVDQVKQQIVLGKKLVALDLGCGYGRVAKDLLKEDKNIRVYGIDISDTYVKIFNKNLTPGGKATKGDIKKLPYKNKSFDIVYMITALMYLVKPDDQRRCLAEIFRVLKPGGRFVFIERNPIGHSIMTLGGLVTAIRGKKHREIKSVSFEERYMTKLVKAAGGTIKLKSGFPFGTLLTPCLYISYSGIKR